MNFGIKNEINHDLDNAIQKLSNSIAKSDENIDEKTRRLNALLDVKEKLNRPNITKEERVELIKTVGVLILMAGVIVYDFKGHILPKSLESWIPKPKL